MFNKTITLFFLSLTICGTIINIALADESGVQTIHLNAEEKNPLCHIDALSASESALHNVRLKLLESAQQKCDHEHYVVSDVKVETTRHGGACEAVIVNAKATCSKF